MKTLLIAHYWYPFNNAGTFRWLYFSKDIDCDVLTTSIPINSTVDTTIPNPNKKTIRFGNRLPAIVWGLIASFVILFKKYDRYIITSPPESLLLGAWLLQLLDRNVIVDMRDSVDRDTQKIKMFIPFYKFLYNRLKNIVVCWKFLDESKPCVCHGYEVEKGDKFNGYYTDRVCHGVYLSRMKHGLIPDQSNKPKGYATSSLHSFLHLNYPINNEFNKEMFTVIPKSYSERAKEMKALINDTLQKA
jgi:hypothetical protein